MRIILIINLSYNKIIMKELHKKALKAYLEMFTIHIDTKSKDTDFHKENEGYYETLFKVAHEIGEKYTDLWGELESTSLEEKKKRAHEIIKELRQEVEKYKENNEITLWTEDLLGSLANDLEDIEWSSRAFLK